MAFLKGFAETREVLNQLQAHNIPPGATTEQLIENLRNNLSELQAAVKEQYQNAKIPDNISSLITNAQQTLDQRSHTENVTPKQPAPGHNNHN